MPNYKNITHVLAVVLSAVAGFVVTPAGQAVIKQYPVLSGVTGVVLMLAAVYHIPVNSPAPSASATQPAVTKAP